MSDDRDSGGAVRAPAPNAEAGGSTMGCLVRLVWLLGGPLALAVGAALLGDARQSASFAGHFVIAGSALLMIGLRYVDVHHLGGQKTNGEPATPADFRRYALNIAVIAVMLWAGAMWWRG